MVSNLIHKIRHDLLWWLYSKVRTEFKGFSNEAKIGVLDWKIIAGVSALPGGVYEQGYTLHQLLTYTHSLISIA
jgi:hypothetical protein